jgi:hypothetical protein
VGPGVLAPQLSGPGGSLRLSIFPKPQRYSSLGGLQSERASGGSIGVDCEACGFTHCVCGHHTSNDWLLHAGELKREAWRTRRRTSKVGRIERVP